MSLYDGKSGATTVVTVDVGRQSGPHCFGDALQLIHVNAWHVLWMMLTAPGSQREPLLDALQGGPRPEGTRLYF